MGTTTQFIIFRPLWRILLNMILELITERRGFPEKLQKKEKENSYTINFFNLNTHGLNNPQELSSLFYSQQQRLIAHYGNKQTFELCIVHCQASALKA